MDGRLFILVNDKSRFELGALDALSELEGAKPDLIEARWASVPLANFRTIAGGAGRNEDRNA
jgi:hypothetical protein